MQENLRQLCVFKLANESGVPWKWWQYVTKFGDECKMSENQYNEECAERVRPSPCSLLTSWQSWHGKDDGPKAAHKHGGQSYLYRNGALHAYAFQCFIISVGALQDDTACRQQSLEEAGIARLPCHAMQRPSIA